MPPLDDDIDEIDNVSEITDETDASKEAEQSVSAESSAAADVKKPEVEDTISVVRNVVDDRAKTEGASSAENAEAGKTPGGTVTKEPDNENFSDVPFNKHPRFRELLDQKRAFEVDAQRYRNVESFIDAQGLVPEEAADLLRIGGLMKTNPAEAWKQMKPVVQKVLEAAGELLPEDLKTMVADGSMTREAAMEVSRSRATVKSVEARQAFDSQRAESRQQVEARNANLGAVSSWEAERRTRDPNFDAKMPAIQKEIAWLQTKDGRPNTPDGVKAQLQKAYDAVSAAYTPPAPVRQQRPAIRPVNGGQVNGSVRPEVNTALDAVKAVMARRAG